MNRIPPGGDVVDGQLVDAADLIAALTAAPFVFEDGATQSFTADGRTTYVDKGRPSDGEWSVTGDGTFASFWPPTYRATYTVRWIVEDGVRVGVSFRDVRGGVRYNGRYQWTGRDHPQAADKTRDSGDPVAANAEGMITLTSAEQDLGGTNQSGATAPDTEDLVITDNSQRGIYEATIGGRTAAGLVYNKVGSRVILLATSVLPEFRGKGVAARLIGGVLDELRRQGKTATVTCPFTAGYVNAHPEYADVLDPAHPGSYTAGRRHAQ